MREWLWDSLAAQKGKTTTRDLNKYWYLACFLVSECLSQRQFENISLNIQDIKVFVLVWFGFICLFFPYSTMVKGRVPFQKH